MLQNILYFMKTSFREKRKHFLHVITSKFVNYVFCCYTVLISCFDPIIVLLTYLVKLFKCDLLGLCKF